MIRVRLFASLRELAGNTDVTEVEAATVGEAVDALGDRHGGRFAAIAGASSFVVNGERAVRETPLADGDELAVLPPVSGG